MQDFKIFLYKSEGLNIVQVTDIIAIYETWTKHNCINYEISEYTLFYIANIQGGV